MNKWAVDMSNCVRCPSKSGSASKRRRGRVEIKCVDCAACALHFLSHPLSEDVEVNTHPITHKHMHGLTKCKIPHIPAILLRITDPEPSTRPLLTPAALCLQAKPSTPARLQPLSSGLHNLWPRCILPLHPAGVNL